MTRRRPIICVLLMVAALPAEAQSLYKYRGPDGDWVYSDRAPPADVVVESRALPQGDAKGIVRVSQRLTDGILRLSAANETFAPVQLSLLIDALSDVALPDAEAAREWVVPAQGQLDLLDLVVNADATAPGIEYRYRWLPGDPGARHRPAQAYRAPFAQAARFPITQAWPDSVTHSTPGSRHAVDIAMPIGTDVHAARAGIVVDTEGAYFQTGAEARIDQANLIRILHDDGTFAVYAHLNRSTVRVRAGDRVQRGQYIADSGNTGFSTGPHLHFAVLRNAGFKLESVPVRFAGPSSAAVEPATGNELVAW